MPFSSQLSSKEFVIGDDNYQSHLDYRTPGGVLLSRGRTAPPPDWQKPRCLGVSSVPIMTEQEIVERAEELERKKARLSDFARANGIPCLDQNGTNYCWINAPTHCVELKRVLQGHRFVKLSPASVGGPLTNFRNVGGWGTAGLKGIAEMGLVPVDKWPANAISRSHNTDANRQLALNFRAEEWDELKTSVLAVATQLVLLNPVAVGFNWWGHEVTYYDVVVTNGRISGLRIRNSWGMEWGDDGFSVLTGSKMVPDDVVTPRSVTAYDYNVSHATAS